MYLLFNHDSKEHFVEWKEDEDTDEFSEDEEDEICSKVKHHAFIPFVFLTMKNFIVKNTNISLLLLIYEISVTFICDFYCISNLGSSYSCGPAHDMKEFFVLFGPFGGGGS